MQAVSWDVGLALLRGPILHPLLLAEASAEQLTLLTVFFFPCVSAETSNQ